MNKAEPKDPTGRITQAELARRLKVSRPSVSKAVKAGRVTPDDDGLFDPIEAELQWVSNTRTNAHGKRKPAAGGYAEARGRKESALARMAELRLAQAEGNLIERSSVDFALADLGARHPSRPAGKLAGSAGAPGFPAANAGGSPFNYQ